MNPPLARLFSNPATCATWDSSHWREVLPQLNETSLIGHLAELLSSAEVAPDLLPPAVVRQLAAHRMAGAALVRRARWECGELSRAFAGSGIPVLLLKGASYVVSGALPGRNRFTGDVDILVKRAELAAAQDVLQRSGWAPVERPPEDEEFVRQWEHQVPAFRHHERLTYVDVHHTVIASGGGHRVDVDQLFARARPVTSSVLLIPSDLDQCLIVAAHFLRSGSADGAFRDLVDFTELLAECEGPATLAERLPVRAREIGLAEALRVASHFASALFGTPAFGRSPPFAAMRAAALLPSGTAIASRRTQLLRRWHGIATTRAAIPWRIMLARTLRRRLRGEPAPIR